MNKKQKQKRYDKNKKIADKVVDGLGKPIDKGIKDLCIILNTMQFETDASCDGHVDIKNNISYYPWVDITYKGVKEDQKRWRTEYDKVHDLEKAKKGDPHKMYKKLRLLQSVMKRKNGRIAIKLEDIINDFYKKKKIKDVDTIILIIISLSSVRLAPYGSEIQITRSQFEKAKRLKMYQKEFWDFEEFLKKKYFGNK